MAVVPQSFRAEDFEQRVLAPLRRLRARTRLYLAARGGLLVLLAIVGAATVQLLLDRWLSLSVDQRVVLNLVLTVLWIWVIWRWLVIPMRRQLGSRLLAGWVDAADPAMEDRLQTAVEFAQADPASDGHAEPVSAELIDSVLAEATERIQPAAFERVLDRRAFRQWLATGFGILLLVGGAFVLRGDVMSLWFERNWLLSSRQWPKQTQLVPIGFDESHARRLPRGEEISLVADVVGLLPRQAQIEWKTASGRSGVEQMSILGGHRVHVDLGLLTEDITFRLRGGDEHTAEYRIVAVDRPRVTQLVARIQPPAYTGLSTFELEQQTAMEVLAGSHIELSAHVNRPLRRARFVSEEGLELEPRVESGAHQDESVLHLAWDQPRSGVYRFELEDVDGLASLNPVRYTLKIIPDQPPVLELATPGAGDLITPEAHIRIRLKAEDAYGLRAVELRAQRNADAPQLIPLPAPGELGRLFTAELALSAQALNARPGDRLRLYALAQDQDPSGPNTGESQPVEIQVVSREDFEHALAERELEMRNEFERLIAAQKSLHEGFSRITAVLPPDGPASPRESQQLVGLMRRQGSHAARCGTLAKRYREMLEEMHTSRMARIADEQRILTRVAAPLESLEHRAMPALSDAWGALREDAALPQRQVATAAQSRVQSEMDQVYRNMLEWEGFREAATTLAQIIEQQKEIRADTLAQLEKELADILGPESPLSEPLSSQPIE